MIKWIIFDAMGVIFTEGDDVYKHLVPFIQERRIISKEEIYIEYRRASLGEINSKTFWKYVGLGSEYPQIEKEYLDSRSDLDTGFVQVARSLSKKYGLGLLSNDIGKWSAYMRNKFSINFFDVVVISGDVYCRKPDPQIFAHFLKDADAYTEECIFIDDRNINLATAKSLGMKTIYFSRKEEKSEKKSEEKSDFIPDMCITSFNQLEDAIERICQKNRLQKT